MATTFYVVRMHAHEVAQALRELSLFLQLEGENPYRSRAYDLAAGRIESLTDLPERAAQGKLEELAGVGAAIATKIQELLKTGRLEALEKMRATYPPGLLALVTLPAVGPKKAATLWKELGVGSVEALKEACEQHRVRGLKGFGEKTEAKILDGIALGVTGRQLLGDVLPHAETLLAFLRAMPEVQRAAVGGSVRRFAETVADVDLLASSNAPEQVVQRFVTHPEVAEIRAQGANGASVRLRSPALQVDLKVLPDEDFATTLHHFTGSKGHHVRLRSRALDRGLSISEWGVFRGEEKLPVPDEATLYRLLSLPEIPPELRENSGEIEAADDGRLPTRLVTENDIQGLVHSHSTWSDGKATLEQMAREAKALGFHYLTVTEHSEAAGYANGLSPARLQSQWKEIDALNAQLAPFRLLKGLEVDILKDGSLDLADALLEQLDVVIGSVHARHSLDEDAMTQRVLRALTHPSIDILGHPTGRLIQEREAYAMRIDEILEQAAAFHVAVEVNGNPHRLDLKTEHVRMAVEKGVALVASVDSHSTEELKHLRFAVGTARRGWVQPEQVLNTLNADDFVARLKERRVQRAHVAPPPPDLSASRRPNGDRMQKGPV